MPMPKTLLTITVFLNERGNVTGNLLTSTSQDLIGKAAGHAAGMADRLIAAFCEQANGAGLRDLAERAMGDFVIQSVASKEDDSAHVIMRLREQPEPGREVSR